jgi:hypothetical protein
LCLTENTIHIIFIYIVTLLPWLLAYCSGNVKRSVFYITKFLNCLTDIHDVLLKYYAIRGFLIFALRSFVPYNYIERGEPERVF